MIFIITQILGGVALIFSGISYFCNNKKNFLIIGLISNMFYGASYIFAGSLIAGINTFISLTRTGLIYRYERKKEMLPMYYVILYTCIYLTIGSILFKSAWDIIPLLTPIMFMFALRVRSLRQVRWLSVLPNVLLIIYGFVYQTYLNATIDIIDCIILTIAIILCEVEIKRSKKKLKK